MYNGRDAEPYASHRLSLDTILLLFVVLSVFVYL